MARIPLDSRLALAGILALVVLALAMTLPKDATTPTAQVASETMSLASVAQHASASDCWTIIDGKVYDITGYINVHPGGRAAITRACGVDATELFRTQGGQGAHSERAYDILTGFALGTADPQPAVTPGAAPRTYTMDEIAQHATENDCWVAIRGKAYDVTQYIPIHPGGKKRIISVCGTDATRAFETQGGEGAHSSRAYGILEGFALGPIEGATPVTTPPPVGRGDDDDEDDDDEWDD